MDNSTPVFWIWICRRPSVRGRSDRGVPLREKGVEAGRETQRLDVTTPCHRSPVDAGDPIREVSQQGDMNDSKPFS